jgi:hypothetical protein
MKVKAKNAIRQMAAKKPALQFEAGRTAVIGGVRVTIPRTPGKPKYHTEAEIREAFRRYFASKTT